MRCFIRLDVVVTILSNHCFFHVDYKVCSITVFGDRIPATLIEVADLAEKISGSIELWSTARWTHSCEGRLAFSPAGRFLNFILPRKNDSSIRTTQPRQYNHENIQFLRIPSPSGILGNKTSDLLLTLRLNLTTPRRYTLNKILSLLTEKFSPE